MINIWAFCVFSGGLADEDDCARLRPQQPALRFTDSNPVPAAK